MECLGRCEPSGRGLHDVAERRRGLRGAAWLQPFLFRAQGSGLRL